MVKSLSWLYEPPETGGRMEIVMSFGRIENYFESMRRVMEIRFILPDDPRYKGFPDGTVNPYYERPAKVLLLLNGYTHNNLEWLMHTNICDLARKYNLAVFMTSGENGFYTNHAGCNEHFGDFVGEEIMQFASSTFGLSDKREDHFVMGLSMGGFGALHTGLAYAKNYSKIAALSSALILYEIAGAKPGFVNAGGDYDYYFRTFGDLETVLSRDTNPEQCILDLQKAGKEIPDLFLACGTEDFLLEHNRRFESFLKDHAVEHEYFESPGSHDYDFWNQYVEKAILWMINEHV